MGVALDVTGSGPRTYSWRVWRVSERAYRARMRGVIVGIAIADHEREGGAAEQNNTNDSDQANWQNALDWMVSTYGGRGVGAGLVEPLQVRLDREVQRWVGAE